MDWLSWTFGVVGGVMGGVVGGVAAGVGALCVIFYPFQLGLALCHRLRGVRHPLEWDEDVVKKENDRWHFTVELMRCWVVQKAI